MGFIHFRDQYSKKGRYNYQINAYEIEKDCLHKVAVQIKIHSLTWTPCSCTRMAPSLKFTYLQYFSIL